MTHDQLCELRRVDGSECTWEDCKLRHRGGNPHCHCGSRAYRLCYGCKRAQHLLHKTTVHDWCQCDLCEAA